MTTGTKLIITNTKGHNFKLGDIVEYLATNLHDEYLCRGKIDGKNWDQVVKPKHVKEYLADTTTNTNEYAPHSTGVI